MTVILELRIPPPFKRLRFIKAIVAAVKSFVGMNMRAAHLVYLNSPSVHPSLMTSHPPSAQTEEKDNMQGFPQKT